VVERLERLAASPDAGKIFGSLGHKWRLEPPLSAAEVADVERQLRVELPGEYRSFLLEAGRGGAGPAYGIFPLRRLDGRWQWEGDGANLTDLDTLTQAFPHTNAFNPADGLPEPPDDGDYDTDEAFTEAEDEYWEQYHAVVDRPEHSIGLLYLCHYGCALRAALVISGPSRGQMWGDETADGEGFKPIRDENGAPFGFARWYRRWLDDAAAKLSLESPGQK
jgi:hypothetical protein